MDNVIQINYSRLLPERETDGLSPKMETREQLWEEATALWTAVELTKKCLDTNISDFSDMERMAAFAVAYMLGEKDFLVWAEEEAGIDPEIAKFLLQFIKESDQ